MRVAHTSANVMLELLCYLEDERGCSIQTRNQRLNAIRAIATKKAAPQPLSWMNTDEIEALIAAPDTK